MIVTVLDRHFNKLTTFDMIDSDNSRFSFISDTQEISITDGLMLSTFKATFSKWHKDAEYITLGNYLAFKDEWGKMWCFTINEITNETDSIREIYCEDLGMDLLNSASLIYESKEERPIEYYLNRELYDSGWSIGINEIKTKKKVEFTSDSTTLKRLQDIAAAFDCEMYFDIEFKGRTLSKQRVNIVKQIGLRKAKERLTNGREITTFSKNINIKNLKTACYASGANGKDIADLTYNDGKFKTNYGSNIVIDIEANERWNRFPNRSKSQMGFYEMVNVSESDNVNVILNDAIKALKAVSEPEATYNAEIVFEPGFKLSIGDHVQLVDPDFKPALLLDARIGSFTVSRSEPSQNKIEISNAKELDSGVSSRIKELQNNQNRLDQANINNISIKIHQNITGDKLVLRAQVLRGSTDITNEFTNSDFSWKRQTVAGDDEAFNSEHYAVGSTISVDLNQVDRRDIFTCQLLVHPFQLVSVSWFQNGLRVLANKIEQYRDKDSVVVLFASDLHQALSSLIRDNARIFQYSNNHIKNMVELTNMVDVDLIVLGGDIADGSTSKPQQKSALKQIMSTLQLSNCAFLACKGNHDDNMWFARTLCGNQYDLRNVIKSNEMTQLLTDPVRYQKGIHVTDFQTSYIDIKGIRHITLNTSDVPYKLDNNGNPMFYTLESVAYSAKQLQWLVDTLASTPDNFKVCIYQHIGFGDTYSKQNYSSYNVDQLMQILNAFQHHKCIQVFNDDPNFKTAINADFTNNKATILYGMHGHYHNDKLMKWKDINIISTGCSAPIPRHLDGTGLLDKRELQTLSEDLFDVMIYTPSKKKIKLLRYGAGKDREIKL